MGRPGTWFCYMLRCSDESLYVGSTKDLIGRLTRHGLGIGARYTSRRLPVKLIWAEQLEGESAARAREAEIKGWSRKKKEKLIGEGSPVEFTLRPEVRAQGEFSGRKPENSGE